MLRGLFRASLAERSGLAGRWRGVSGRLGALTARAGQAQGSRAGVLLTSRLELGHWSILFRRYHDAGKKKKGGGLGHKDTAVRKAPVAQNEDRRLAIAWTKEIDRLGEARDVQGLLRFASEHVQDFDYRNCGAWLSRWARQPPQHLRGTAPAEVVSVLERALQLLRRGEGVDSFFASNLANSLSKLEYGGGWRRLRDEVLGAVSGWCEAAGFGGFTPQGLGNLINGFAKLEHYPGKDILDALAAECLGRGFAGFDAQAMANVINGFAKLEHDPGQDMLKALVDECLQRGFGGFLPQHIANMINGFAKLGYPPGNEMLTALADECLQRGFGGFNAQDIANVVNGFAKLGYYPGEAVLQIAAALCLGRRFAGFIPQDLANIIHGLAVLRHHPGEAFLQQLCMACGERRFEGFNEQDLSNTLYALALLRHRPDEAWMGCFLQRCREVGWGSTTMQGLHLRFWAMEVLELRLDGGLVEELAARLRAAGKEVPADVMMTCMAVRQVLHLQRQAGADEALRQLAVASEAAWAGVKHLAESPTRSNLQREVGKMLREEGYEVKEEVTLDERLSVDFMVRRRGGGGGSAVAVEVDGAAHFFRNRLREATGEAVLKWRLMDKAVERGEVDAWVSVPWWVVHVHESLEGRRQEGEIREDLRRLVERALSGRSRPGS